MVTASCSTDVASHGLSVRQSRGGPAVPRCWSVLDEELSAEAMVGCGAIRPRGPPVERFRQPAPAYGPAMDKLDDVWTSRDYPVLREVTQRIDQGAGLVNTSDIAATLSMTEEASGLALAALERRGLVSELVEAIGVGYPLGVCEVSGAAYLLTGLHPDGDEALSSLMSALRQAADSSADEDERGRLRRAADALGGISRDIGAGVLTAWLTHQVGT